MRRRHFRGRSFAPKFSMTLYFWVRSEGPCFIPSRLIPSLRIPLLFDAGARSPNHAERTNPPKTQAQADGYAHEARRRLGAPPTTCADQSTKNAQDDAEPTVGRPPITTEAAAPSAHDFGGSSTRSIDSDAGSEQPGSLGIAPAGTRGGVDARQASGTDPLESGGESARRCSDVGSSSGGGGGVRRGCGGSSRFDQHPAESVVFAMLEASLRCSHGWLCREAFGEAAAMMGHGDGEGLPASPRELTTVIVLLQRCLSLLWVADGRRRKG